MVTPHWLKQLYEPRQDTVSNLVRNPSIPEMLELPLDDKLELFKRMRSFLKNQQENYSISDRVFLREIKKSLIKDLSELKD